MSFLLNWMGFDDFKKYFGIIADPIKNPINARIRVITKLLDGRLIDKSKNNANKNKTINGLKT